MPDVRSVSATPIVADFADTRGTPLVVDRVGKTVYFLDSTDTVTAISGGGGGGAPTGAQYITLATDATLTQERVITAGTGITLTDAGAGSTLTVTNSLPARTVGASLNFGASFSDKAQTVVIGQAWVTANSRIAPQVLTPAGTDPDEMYLLDLRPVISDIVAGTGWTITLYSMPEARGSYTVMCVGN
jgi:hypothetical protein